MDIFASHTLHYKNYLTNSRGKNTIILLFDNIFLMKATQAWEGELSSIDGRPVRSKTSRKETPPWEAIEILPFENLYPDKSQQITIILWMESLENNFPFKHILDTI